jgi:hypothetical protein
MEDLEPVPVPAKPPHEHPKPVFGCPECIADDREAFARHVYAKWKDGYKLPRCKECGNPMLHYGLDYTPKVVKGLLCCSAHDVDGVPTCDELVEVVLA